MLRRVSIGSQNFEKIRINNIFYVDKTFFIKEWWEAADDVTLITRPRRFGKTLNMSMLEQFFSIDYAGRNELFEGLSVWEDEKYRKLQGNEKGKQCLKKPSSTNFQFTTFLLLFRSRISQDMPKNRTSREKT